MRRTAAKTDGGTHAARAVPTPPACFNKEKAARLTLNVATAEARNAEARNAEARTK